MTHMVQLDKVPFMSDLAFKTNEFLKGNMVTAYLIWFEFNCNLALSAILYNMLQCKITFVRLILNALKPID